MIERQKPRHLFIAKTDENGWKTIETFEKRGLIWAKGDQRKMTHPGEEDIYYQAGTLPASNDQKP